MLQSKTLAGDSSVMFSPPSIVKHSLLEESTSLHSLLSADNTPETLKYDDIDIEAVISEKTKVQHRSIPTNPIPNPNYNYVYKEIPMQNFESQQDFENNGSQSFENNGSQNFENNGSQNFDNDSNQNFENNDAKSYENNGRQNFENSRQDIENRGRKDFKNNDAENFENKSRQNFDTNSEHNYENNGRQNFENNDVENFESNGRQNFENNDIQNYNDRQNFNNVFKDITNVESPRSFSRLNADRMRTITNSNDLASENLIAPKNVLANALADHIYKVTNQKPSTSKIDEILTNKIAKENNQWWNVERDTGQEQLFSGDYYVYSNNNI